MITTRRHRAAIALLEHHHDLAAARSSAVSAHLARVRARDTTVAWLLSRADGYDADANHPTDPDDAKRDERRRIQRAVATELRALARDLEAQQ